MTAAPFAKALAALATHEALAAVGDSDRLNRMIDALSCALGFVLAVASRGEQALFDEILLRSDDLAAAEAIAQAPFAAALNTGAKP